MKNWKEHAAIGVCVIGITLACLLTLFSFMVGKVEQAEADDPPPPPMQPIPQTQQEREELAIKLAVEFYNATQTNWTVTIRRRENPDNPEHVIRKRFEKMLNESFTNWDVNIQWKDSGRAIPISNTNTNQ